MSCSTNFNQQRSQEEMSRVLGDAHDRLTAATVCLLPFPELFRVLIEVQNTLSTAESVPTLPRRARLYGSRAVQVVMNTRAASPPRLVHRASTFGRNLFRRRSEQVAPASGSQPSVPENSFTHALPPAHPLPITPQPTSIRPPPPTVQDVPDEELPLYEEYEHPITLVGDGDDVGDRLMETHPYAAHEAGEDRPPTPDITPGDRLRALSRFVDTFDRVRGAGIGRGTIEAIDARRDIQALTEHIRSLELAVHGLNQELRRSRLHVAARFAGSLRAFEHVRDDLIRNYAELRAELAGERRG